MGNKLKDRIRLNNIYGMPVQDPIEEFEYENYKWNELYEELYLFTNILLVEDKYIPSVFADKFKDQIYKFLLKYKKCFIYKTEDIYKSILNKFDFEGTLNFEDICMFLKYLYDQGKILIGYQVENYNYLR